MDEENKACADVIERRFNDRVQCGEKFGMLVLETAADNLLELIGVLRDDSRMKFVCLTDICGVDYLGRAARFDVVYHLLSLNNNMRVRISVPVNEGSALPSITGLFSGASWYEREAYDLFGIVFTGHPDLRRLLTDYGFEGYPLRKDFPLSGHVEVRYDHATGAVIQQPVSLSQGFRDFDFTSPWEGEGNAREEDDGN